MVRLHLSRQLTELRSEPCEYPRVDNPWEKGPHMGQYLVYFKEQQQARRLKQTEGRGSSEIGNLVSARGTGGIWGHLAQS